MTDGGVVVVVVVVVAVKDLWITGGKSDGMGRTIQCSSTIPDTQNISKMRVNDLFKYEIKRNDCWVLAM
jgi:hypothetical protein